MTGAANRPSARVVARAELLASGRVDKEIGRLVRTGELRRVTRGWYSAAPAPDQERDALERIKAMLRRAPSLVGSHESAALVHGLPLVHADLGTVHLTRNARTGARRTEGRTLHARPLLPEEIASVRGLRVTTVARTLIDLGCSSTDVRSVVAAADEAMHTGRLTPAELGAALDDAGRRDGIARARLLLRFADGRAESPGESVLRWHLVQDLPAFRPEPQVEVYAADGTFLGRVDLAYWAFGVVLEFDGFVKYQKLLRQGQDASSVVVEEKRREDRMREQGVLVIRLVWADLFDPVAIGDRVRAALRLGRRARRAGLVTAVLRGTPAVRIPPDSHQLQPPTPPAAGL